MQATLGGLVAIFGTILGSIVTFVFQRKTADRAAQLARNEWLLQQRMAAYTAFGEALLDFRRAQTNRWFRLHEGSETDPEFIAARDESYRLRAAAIHAMLRVQLVAHNAELARLASEAVHLASQMTKCRDQDDLATTSTQTRAALETFISAAANLFNSNQATEIQPGLGSPDS